MPKRSGSDGSDRASDRVGAAGSTEISRPSGARSARSARLADARLYLCTDARERQGDLASFLHAVLANGVDIVQLRQKGLEAAQELDYLSVFAAACARHDALLAVNDRADIAYAADAADAAGATDAADACHAGRAGLVPGRAGADVLHLGQDDLPVEPARRILGQDVLIGRSTHSRDEVDFALREEGVDYFCVGPTWSTPTKPGRPAPGPDLLSYAATREGDRPWFAIGGVSAGNLDEVLDRGARRVVVVRAITEASDPGAAAADLSRRLRERPLTARPRGQEPSA